MRLAEQWRAIDPAWRFALVAFLTARVALTLWAALIALLLPVVVQNLELFGTPVLATFDLASSERHAYARELDGRILTFRLADASHVTDAQTSSVWSLRDGQVVEGAEAGRALNRSTYSVEDIFPYRGVATETNPLLALWQRFDANWYVAIAEHGYGNIDGDVHFPPLYPALVRLVAIPLGDYFFAALLISNLATLAMLVVLYQVVRDQFDDSVAARATAYLLIFPTAFFFFSAYTESLFLLVALLALRAMQSRAWLWVGFWSFCAILIRLQGIALVVPLLYALWRAHLEGTHTGVPLLHALWLGRPIDQRVAKLLSLVLPAGAIGLYLFIRLVSGDSTVIPTSEPSLFARLVPPWENYVYALQTLVSGRFTVADVLNWLTTTIFVALLVIGWRKLPIEFSLFAAASVIVLTMRLVDTQPLNSMSRYALTLFPVFMVLGVWGNRGWVQRAIVYPSVLLALYASAQFFLWGWIG